MPRPTPVVPPYRLQKSRNLAYTILGGRQVYLGPYGSAESRERHARIVREAAAARQAGGTATAAVEAAAGSRVDPELITVAQVLAGFWAHAKVTYPYDASFEGKRPPGEIGNYWDVMQPLLRLYASTPAAQFTPRALRLVRDEMIAMDWCRNVVNRSVVRVRTIFKWAMGEELIPPTVSPALKGVAGLRKGQRGVRSTPPVQPVPPDVLRATLAHCPPRLAAMVRVQLYTGMRSGNLVMLRTADVDRSRPKGFKAKPARDGKPRRWNWRYKPRSHKTEHHGHTLVIRIGPRARKALRPYLKPDRPEVFIFSPAEEMAEVRAARAAARTTPASCGNRPGTNVKRSPKKAAGDHYSPRSYAQAVNRAADRADLAARRAAAVARGIDPETVAADVPRAERLVPRWHPHQLRHNKGTAVRARHGTDGVLAALGQRTAAMADRYAEIEAEKAERVAADLG